MGRILSLVIEPQEVILGQSALLDDRPQRARLDPQTAWYRRLPCCILAMHHNRVLAALVFFEAGTLQRFYHLAAMAGVRQL